MHLKIVVRDFLDSTDDVPLPPETPTRRYMEALRAFLDDSWPQWRQGVFDEAPAGTRTIYVDLVLASGQKVRGALIQRPSIR